MTQKHLPTVIIGILGAVAAAVSPLILKGQMDWWLLVPTASAAIAAYLQKNDGPWLTTLIGSLASSLLNAAEAINNPHPNWLFIVATIIAQWSLFFTHDISAPPASSNTTK